MPDTPINPEATATEDAFARFRFAGGRFDSHTIPLEVLPDLAAYRKLVVEVAKMLFRRRMGTRVRVPKGFEDSFQIGLARIEGGRSAVAYMPRLPPVAAPPSQQPLNFAANQPSFVHPQYPDFDDARDYIDNLIDSVGSTGSVPQEFPVELAGLFNSFGQSLLEDEFIELGFGGAKPVRYDTFIRKKIVLSRETMYENAVDAQFLLNGGVVAQGTIHVLDVNGGGFDFQPSTEFEFKKAYDRASENVRLVGTGLYDKNDRLRRLLSVNVIYSEGGATQPFESRLEEIRATPAGWYDDENPAPSPAAIEAMRSLLVFVSKQPVPLPHLYPLPSGGIAAEWTIGAWEASAEVNETGSQVHLNAVNTDTVDEVDMVIDLQSTELMSQFMTFMNVMSTDEEVPDAN
ncbi:MAG TPA: hypothetical protein VD932_08965 [Aquabacterium sp.]|nr:hypothetical protein [Aquabacterium sp.]